MNSAVVDSDDDDDADDSDDADDDNDDDCYYGVMSSTNHDDRWQLTTITSPLYDDGRS